MYIRCGWTSRGSTWLDESRIDVAGVVVNRLHGHHTAIPVKEGFSVVPRYWVVMSDDGVTERVKTRAGIRETGDRR